MGRWAGGGGGRQTWVSQLTKIVRFRCYPKVMCNMPPGADLGVRIHTLSAITQGFWNISAIYCPIFKRVSAK